MVPFQKSADAASITLTLPVMSAGRTVVTCLTGAKKVRCFHGGRMMAALAVC